MYLVFLIIYIYIYIKVATSYHLPKKRGALKGTQISFLRSTFFSRSLIVATPLEMSRAKLRIRLKWPNVYPFFAWYSCLFVYLCLMGCCILFLLYGILLFVLCHSNNNVCTSFQKFCGGSNHGSPFFIKFGYPMANSPTYSLKSLDHFLLTVTNKPCHLD